MVSENSIAFGGVGTVIRDYRERSQLTLDTVATRVGINKSTLQRYETNETPLSDRMIHRIAVAMGVKPAVLMRDCLFHLRPKIKGSPFGKILAQMVEDF